jgi:toluene monooxygenase system protein E
MSPRTYWHLEAARRKPSDYEIGTSKLLYYTERGPEVRTPVTAWHERYQAGSPLRARDWERFCDPRATTYASYTELQHAQETYLDGVLDAADKSGQDHRLSRECLALLERCVPVLRYPIHGLQMAAAYAGSMAPEGRLVVACAFQAADELRRVQRLAYRMRQLQDVDANFGAGARAAWQADPVWQPLRASIERLLVTWDWGEALVALGLVVKPSFDELWMAELGSLAQAAGDDVLPRILQSLASDCSWHRAWMSAALHVAIEDDPAIRGVVGQWVERWKPMSDAALAALEPIFGPEPVLRARAAAAAYRGEIAKEWA